MRKTGRIIFAQCSIQTNSTYISMPLRKLKNSIQSVEIVFLKKGYIKAVSYYEVYFNNASILFFVQEFTYLSVSELIKC